MKEMLKAMTVKELRNYVKENGLKIANLYTLKKDELVEAILAAEPRKAEIVEAVLNAEEGKSVEEVLKEMDALPEGYSDEEENEIARLEELSSEEGYLWKDSEGAVMGFAPDMFAEAVDAENNEPKENGHQKIAKKYLRNAYNWIIGGLENTLSDNEESSEWYQNADKFLHNNGCELQWHIYTEALSTKYEEDMCGGPAPKEIRLAGTKFCLDFLKELLQKDGYWTKFDDDMVAAIPRRERIDGVGRRWYVCPFCENKMKNPDEFCYSCGHVLNNNMTLYKHNIAKTRGEAKAKRIGANHFQCSHCDAHLETEHKFCFTCGQKIVKD